MARRKTKARKKASKRSSSASAAKRTLRSSPRVAAKPRATVARSRGGAKASPGSDVERRWKEYWACRSKLEAAVGKVKTVRGALQEAQEAERSCRAEFETIKSSLTSLLDVEPAGGGAKQPTVVPPRSPSSSPQGLPAPQVVGQKPKPAS